MSSQTIAYIAAWSAGVIFSAGGAWAWTKHQSAQTRKDVNGIGTKVRLLQGLLIRWAQEEEDSGRRKTKTDQIARIVEGK